MGYTTEFTGQINIDPPLGDLRRARSFLKKHEGKDV